MTETATDAPLYMQGYECLPVPNSDGLYYNIIPELRADVDHYYPIITDKIPDNVDPAKAWYNNVSKAWEQIDTDPVKTALDAQQKLIATLQTQLATATTAAAMVPQLGVQVAQLTAKLNKSDDTATADTAEEAK